ncbi:MAG: HpcH/HpaI aldolase family protein [Aggregatilineales bacterium]
MQKNQTKAKLKTGGTVYGCFVRYPSAGLVEVIGYQPWDFIVFDGEHGTIEPRDCENMVRAAELRGVTPIVRVTTNQPHIILRFMDTGAQGLHVPWVNSANEAEQVVRAVKYHPHGIRGLAGVRAADYAQTMPLNEYVQQANAETLVVIQIETQQAVEQLPEIIGIEGIDVIFIGPTDLSQSYGEPGQPQHPSVQKAMTQIVEVVAKSDKALGIMVSNAQAAQQWRERGARYISISLESLLTPAVRDYLTMLRG